ncbi:hypothetical protein [Streptomyces catenulae]|uniref:Uncharacterized protein n=1 Tax=Streptomyces catenulae TaxID=66875 RepID=A0ABV2YXB1_9ACTN|nr:hypothetical protein [Streptomyces catenulae]
MPESVEFRWIKMRHGWATFEIYKNSSNCRISVGDGVDAPRLILDAISALLNGASSVTFSFDGEPTEVRWHIRRERSSLNVKITLHSEWGAPEEDEPAWSSDRIDLAQFALSVKSAQENLMASLGESGYQREWPTHRTPNTALAEIEESIEKFRKDYAE